MNNKGLDSKILVVDDSMAMRLVIVRFLQKMGFKEIVEADDGELAYLQLKEGILIDDPFDLIVSDWFMPNITGLEFLKKVRLDDQLKELPFLMITAEGEEAHVLMAKEAGVTEIIIKPFSIDQVHEKVKKILNLP